MLQIPVAKVAVLAATFAFDRPYTYKIPQPLTDTLRPGCRVMVPFSRGNRPCEGMVLALDQAQDDPKLKPITRQLDPEPILSPELIRLAIWMHDRFFCTIYDALHAILPAGVWYRVSTVYCAAPELDADAALTLCGRSKQRRLALETVLAHGGRCPLETLQTAFGDKDPASTLHWLVEQKLLTVEGAEKRVVRDKQLEYASLAVSLEEAQEEIRRRRRAPHQVAILELLCTIGRASADEVCQFTGAPKSSMKTLVRQELVHIDTEPYFRRPTHYTGQPKPIPVLTAAQAEVFSGLQALLRSPDAQAALLFGVTGSGKTLVYLHLIEQALAAGQGAILLVPEISLTPQMIEAFSAYFGDAVAVLHSGLPLSERYDEWKRIRAGLARVVVGTRSAVFAPMENLGLLIIDEEQEDTYKSESTPRYHARDVAKFRCAQHRALLLLGSATPTIETAYAAKNNRYQVFSLHKRFNDLPLPKVLIADMKDELRQGNETSIGHALRAELEKNIERGEQSILFLNRRGSARMLLCGECGYVPQCPRCSVPMTYHSANERLMCHYCGHSEAVVDRCSECGGLMKRVGSGTQKVEQELFDLFPKAKVLRMDADTVGASHGHEALLREFEEKKIPILLGTQMVAKGLDFENVTLVGVLDADLSLYAQNYHAAERTYSLLAQVVGRAGRGEHPGRAVIQTYHPENEVIQAAAKQDYETFYQNELRMRSLRRYPPFADLFTLTVSGLDELRVIAAARALCDALRYASSQPPLSGLDVEVLGPAGAPVVKVNNRYRYCVYLCGKGGSVLRRTVSEYLLAFYARKENRGLDIFADCNALQ